ncbi:MAG: DUF2141 domain-containing protein [Woeseiaceae bacterium]|nr:DUF2141 domain-containing protein [Woeseiaceae bacterium]
MAKRMRTGAAALLLLVGSMARADSGTLIVEVRDLEFNEGVVRFAMFDSEENFFKKAVANANLEVSDNSVTWVVNDLPFGTYAVTVYHDVNDNGEMERAWYGKPKEPTGASTNPSLRFGPPTFEKSKFEFAASEMTLSISVK